MTDSAARSTFVTVLAWIFIVLGGFATLIGAMQNVMIFLLFPQAEMNQALNADPAAQQLPAIARFMFSNFEFLFLGFFLVALLTFISAIGLLKRRNWARRVFIGILCMGIAWNVGGYILQQSMMTTFNPPAEAPPDFAANFETMFAVMRVITGIVALAFTALFTWLIWRLMSPRIKAEFHADAAIDGGGEQRA